ncbi:MAG: hypothetical protein RBS38_11900 [Bacteroidales bacterium]|jgi:hypothetical protein|nr:hypothetical protein [Bacteroidales bacterium]
MLKTKGMERDVVIIVRSAPADKKILFQLFIGASRAKAKIYFLAGNRYQPMQLMNGLSKSLFL